MNYTSILSIFNWNSIPKITDSIIFVLLILEQSEYLSGDEIFT